ncbi:phospholipid-translocating P-type ATPase [Gonapodya prolifera JEL478]|uniref:Phospholipid-translocating P-type ATPase n=1 Tax=Gonapodya prolifera (strain JEL478) TaxID=1344416 RepID=A0A139A0K5_GONPJ|nr:phospholipid-translocating P-type ATPase [Gonapodya prolifera JEL478]|eukprot:KXS10299.1 phospholipid-translocating P-type ATPase [Gonapodya prolifera JEL478]
MSSNQQPQLDPIKEGDTQFSLPFFSTFERDPNLSLQNFDSTRPVPASTDKKWSGDTPASPILPEAQHVLSTSHSSSSYPAPSSPYTSPSSAYPPPSSPGPSSPLMENRFALPLTSTLTSSSSRPPHVNAFDTGFPAVTTLMDSYGPGSFSGAASHGGGGGGPPPHQGGGAGAGTALARHNTLDVSESAYSVRYPRAGKPARDKNYIKTTKYTVLSFIPLNLIGQFRRIYNLYFLLGALTTFSGVATVSKTSATMPLAFVVGITMIKDGVEDYRRYQADSRANATKYTVVRGDKLEQVESRNIAPGDICMVLKGEKFPSDLVLLSSSIDDGTCFIETSDLDGETNLKRRTAVPELSSLQDLEEVVLLRGVVRCPLPNEKLNEFDGTLSVSDSVDVHALQQQGAARDLLEGGTPVSPQAAMNGKRQTFPLSVGQFLPRGAVLRNTEYVFGIVVYAGLDTKIMRNLRATSLKFSTLQGKLNWLVFGIFLYNVFLLAYSVVAQISTQRSYVIPYQETKDPYLGPWYLWDPTDAATDKFLNITNWSSETLTSVLTWFAIYTYVIPISLFVSMELTRIFQGLFMTADLKMEGRRKEERVGTTTQLGAKGGEELRRRQSTTSVFGREAARVPSAGASVHSDISSVGTPPISPGSGNQSAVYSKSFSLSRPRTTESARVQQPTEGPPRANYGSLPRPTRFLSLERQAPSRITGANNALLDQAPAGSGPTANSPLPGISGSLAPMQSEGLGAPSPSSPIADGRTSLSSTRAPSVSGSLVSTSKRNRSALKMSTQLRGGTLVKEAKYVPVPMRANNTNLNEDLGCVEYVFSDKTGTLTQNEMRMARWWVAGDTLDELASPRALMRRAMDSSLSAKAKEDYLTYIRALILAHEVIPSVDDSTGELVYESQSPDETAILEGLKTNNIRLVGRTKAALSVSILDSTVEQDYELLVLLEFNSDRKRMSVVVRHPPPRGSPPSTKGPIFLYCKGADNIILSRLSKDPGVNDPALIRSAERALESFSVEGLRTLVVASKQIPEDEWNRLDAAFQQASMALEDRERKVNAVFESVETELKLAGLTAIEDRLQDEVPETIAYLLKANVRVWVLTGDKQETAINIGMSARLLTPDMNLYVLNSRSESEITEQISEAIERLKSKNEWGKDHVTKGNGRGIFQQIFGSGRAPFSQGSGFGDPPELEEKWRKNGLVVTGDVLNVLFATWSVKEPTAGTLRKKQRRGRVTADPGDADNLGGRPQSRASLASNRSQGGGSKLTSWMKNIFKRDGQAGLGGELTELQRQFLELGTRCHSVVCCRVTPLQKAQIVKLVRNHLGKVTLAIGDGANDVTMIQAADVGVGIIGREGAQAVRAADFAFLEFKFLRRLLALHGRYDYMRMCKIIFVSFYKNLAMITQQWIFGFVSMWTGIAPYDDLFLLAYNVIYVSLPPLVLAIFEKDVDEDKIEEYPEAYREVQAHLYWDLKTFLLYIVGSLWVCAAIFVAVYRIVEDGAIGPSGRVIGFYNLIWFYTTAVFIAVLIKFILVTRHWTYFHLLGIVLSVVIFVIGIYMSVLLGYSETSFAGDVASVPAFYFAILLLPVALQVPDFLVMAIRDTTAPPDYVVLREEEHRERTEKHLDVRSAEEHSSTRDRQVTSPADRPRTA